jgi:hypothetical protein
MAGVTQHKLENNVGRDLRHFEAKVATMEKSNYSLAYVEIGWWSDQRELHVSQL